MGINAPNLQQLAAGLPSEVQDALRSALSAQNDFNAKLAQLINAAQQPQAPQYVNAWVEFGGNTKSRYWMLPFGLVHLSLTMKSGVIGSTAFVLPVAFAGKYDITFPAYTNQAGNEVGKLVVLGQASGTPGVVIPATGSNTLYAVEASWMVGS